MLGCLAIAALGSGSEDRDAEQLQESEIEAVSRDELDSAIARTAALQVEHHELDYLREVTGIGRAETVQFLARFG